MTYAKIVERQLQMADLEILILVLRSAQAVFSLTIFGLALYVVHWWDKYWHDMPPSQISFLVCCSVWSLVCLVYFVGTANRPSLRKTCFKNEYIVLALDSLNIMVWFTGSINLAVLLGRRVCFGIICHVAKAAIAFSALQWLLFSLTTSYRILIIFHATRPDLERAPAMEHYDPAKLGKQQKQRDLCTKQNMENTTHFQTPAHAVSITSPRLYEKTGSEKCYLSSCKLCSTYQLYRASVKTQQRCLRSDLRGSSCVFVMRLWLEVDVNNEISNQDLEMY
jgi:hypothetical protein